MEMKELIYIMDQMDIIDNQKNIWSNGCRIYLFSSVHGIHLRIDYMLGHNKPQQINKNGNQIISCIISDHHGMRLEINNWRNARKYKYIESDYVIIPALVTHLKIKVVATIMPANPKHSVFLLLRTPMCYHWRISFAKEGTLCLLLICISAWRLGQLAC